MTFVGHRISKILIHLLFWALFVFISLFLFSDFYWKENPFLQYFFILVALVYVNNGLLLPFFVKRKLYVMYVLVIGAIAFFATQAYCHYFAQCGCTVPKCLSNYLWQTLVPIVFFSFLWMLYSYLEKQDEIEVVQKEKTEMELQFLKSQINPHVLFNNLNTIYSYSLEKPEQVPQMILMLSDNLKHVLYESNAQKIDLEKELTYIDNYISFQKIRTEHLKKIEYRKNVGTNNLQIAPLLLITIIENTFKHSPANSTIRISVSLKENVLECLCENEVLPTAKHEKETQIGLKNLKKRLTLLYKDKYRLSFEQTDIFKVQLNLDL